MTFVPFQPHTVLPAAGLNAALTSVDADALAAGTAAAAAATEAATAETAATAAATEAAAALAAAQAAGGGTVRSVNGIGPDGSGNVVIATSSGPTLTRPSFALFTDSIQPAGPGWSDDGASYAISTAPSVTYGSAAAFVAYAGKPVPAYDPGTNTRTITAEILSSFPDADGVKVGIALHDPATGVLYTVAIGSDFNSIPGSVSSYYRPVGVLAQTVTGLSTGSAGSKPQGTRSAGPVFSLQHGGRLWLRLVDNNNYGVTGAFSRDGTQWTPLPYVLQYSYNGPTPAAPTWGIFADVGINNQADWYSAMYSPALFAARVLSFVES